ncbi:hypothetical protein CDV55_101337 [Aspergillus turcosus]|nr:hypothetical protein CDV55_101337 [Aspergillus turcosus]
MKGLVGGIPLALLVAAVANGYGIGKGHGDAGHDGPTTVIGGPSGDDGGNSAAIDFDSSYSSEVKDAYKDDHSFHLKNNVVAPPMHGFRKRGHSDAGHDGPATVIGGPSGDDDGNEAAIEFDSDYSSIVEDWYKDDHSMDIKNHIIHPPPVPGFRKRGHRDAEPDGPTTVIGGPSGDDGGNSASIEFDSSYASSVKDWYKEDHSFDEKNHIVTPPLMHGFRKRGDRGATVIGGPSGDDGGNSAEVEFDSSYASSVKDWYKDDHSFDEKNHIVSPPPMHGFRKRGDRGATVIGGPSGDDGGNSAEVEFDSSYASSVKDWSKDDHSVDIDNHIIHPPPMPGFRKRQGNTVIGGPSGDDGGNSAEVEFDSSYASSVEDWYKDDHSVDIKNKIIHPPPMPGFRKRQGNTVIGGPSGDDGGNSAEVDFESDYTSSVEDWYKDDHSVDMKNNIIHPGYWKRDDGGNHISSPDHDEDDDATEVKDHGKHHKHKGDAVIGGPSGNDGGGSADIEFDSDYSSEVEDHHKDDHSVDIKNHIIHPPPIPGFRRRGDGPFATGGPSDPAFLTSGSSGGPQFLSSGPSDPGPITSGRSDPGPITSGPSDPGPITSGPSNPGPIVIGGPSGNDGGNSANIVFDSDYSSNVNDHYKDDHSVQEENSIVQPPSQPHPPPFVAKPEPPAPAPSKPCSTSTYLETIVKTLSEEPKPTKPAVPEHSQEYEPKPSSPSYPEHTSKPSYSYEPSPPSYPEHTSKPSYSYEPSSSYPTHTYPPVPVYKPSSPSYPTHASEAVPSGVSPTHEPEGPKAEYDPGYSKSQPGRPPCTSSKAQAHYEPPAPSYPPHAEPVYSAPAEPAHEPTTTTPCPSRKPTTPSYPAQESANAQPVYSAPTTSSCTSSKPTETHAKPTETHAKPVYSPPSEPAHEPQSTTTPCTSRKPTETHAKPVYSAPSEPAYEPQPKPQPTTTPCTTRKPAHTEVEPMTSTSTITVSRTTSFHTTACTSAKAHRPSDVDAEYAPSSVIPSHSAKTLSPMPSQSMMYTGAAGRLTLAAGVVSAVCGLMAVLAFVL